MDCAESLGVVYPANGKLSGVYANLMFSQLHISLKRSMET